MPFGGSNPATQLVTLLMVIGFMLGAGLLALGEFQDTMTANSSEANATSDAISGLGNFAGMLPTVGTMIGIALLLMVIGIAFAYFQGWT